MKMYSFEEYVNLIKEKQGVTTNYAVAKLLWINPSTMGELIAGKRHCPNIAAYRIADLLEMNQAEVRCCLDYEKEKDPAAKEYIKSVFFRYAHKANIAALVLILCGFVGFNAPAKAGSLSLDDVNMNKQNVILCEVKLQLSQPNKLCALASHLP